MATSDEMTDEEALKLLVAGCEPAEAALMTKLHGLHRARGLGPSDAAEVVALITLEVLHRAQRIPTLENLLASEREVERLREERADVVRILGGALADDAATVAKAAVGRASKAVAIAMAERAHRVAREAYLMACIDRQEAARAAADVEVAASRATLLALGVDP